MKLFTKRPYRELFSHLFDARVPWLFVLGSVAFGVAGNTTFNLIVKYIGEPNKWQLWIVLIVSIGMLFFIAFILWIRTLRVRNSTLDGSEAFAVTRTAIIYTVGKSGDILRMSLDHQKPNFVGFICTKESESIAEDIAKEYSMTDSFCKKTIVQPWDIKSIYSGTLGIISFMEMKHIEAENIVVDVTGGFTTLSIGAFRAAEDRRVDTQYLRSEYKKDGDRIPGTEAAILLTRNNAAG
jgi:hypothetical protein